MANPTRVSSALLIPSPSFFGPVIFAGPVYKQVARSRVLVFLSLRDEVEHDLLAVAVVALARWLLLMEPGSIFKLDNLWDKLPLSISLHSPVCLRHDAYVTSVLHKTLVNHWFT
jgi:hypothetical protein